MNACSECGHKVSNKAEACPKCGNPITAISGTGRPLQTIQQTSKPLKFQIIISIILLVGGLLWMFLAPESEDVSVAPGIVTIVGLVWLIVTRIRIWWHHK